MISILTSLSVLEKMIAPACSSCGVNIVALYLKNLYPLRVHWGVDRDDFYILTSLSVLDRMISAACFRGAVLLVLV